jgi:hypothetical protein
VTPGRAPRFIVDLSKPPRAPSVTPELGELREVQQPRSGDWLGLRECVKRSDAEQI